MLEKEAKARKNWNKVKHVLKNLPKTQQSLSHQHLNLMKEQL